MGAGAPAKQAPGWLARAAPVFAGTPAPTGDLLSAHYKVRPAPASTRKSAAPCAPPLLRKCPGVARPG
ncbi:hypothetical protein C6A77_20735 [Pseudomonas sp. AFG_SD02_1510_Pfu_092]|nr:hypothetical protein C6A77_20735 [Pseudomonas sp. AFG_SD02_1510_Pfu_092]